MTPAEIADALAEGRRLMVLQVRIETRDHLLAVIEAQPLPGHIRSDWERGWDAAVHHIKSILHAACDDDAPPPVEAA